MDLRHSYTLASPVYDLLIDRPTRAVRHRSLARLSEWQPRRVLICGIGTGLDIPYLPPGPRYVGMDLTVAMLRRARRRAAQAAVDVSLHAADVHRLPYAHEAFDAVVMHLILAVAPRPSQALVEIERVLVPGGHVLIFDKFLRRGQRAPLRRLISPLLRRLATQTDVVFEEVLEATPTLIKEADEPVVGRGWFRHITLCKAQAPAT